MRILFVSYMHPSVTPGGAQQVADEMRQAAIARGHEAFMVAALEADQEGAFGKPGAPIVPMPGEKNQYFYFPQHYNFVHKSVGEWRSLKFFHNLVASIAPDVIHFHHYHRIGVESIRAARMAAPDARICMTFHEMMAICLAGGQMVKTTNRDLCRKATPIDCHGCFEHLRPEFFTLREARLQAILDECDFFFFPSEFISRRYQDWGLDPAKCHVVPNGQVHPEPRVERSRHSRGVNRFGFFGQFIDNKGIDVILDAVLLLAREERLPEGGVEIMINGGNRHYATKDYLARVDALIAEIRALDDDRVRIHELGRYSRDELAERMMMVDWVIAPSTWWEVFGLVVSEAWMFGRPAIVSDIAGLGERVKHEVNGFTFPARNSAALADLIAELAGNELEWRRAHEGIKPDWSELDMFDAHMQVWGEPEGKPAPPPKPDAKALAAEIGPEKFPNLEALFGSVDEA
ncbi:glycosyltransferase [Rhodoblastus acidophilus]|uniref:Glycosyltransferase n=1 Tax=Candidatus Rhodoblastus alkanivorans TaxID=2954117 RepID=A0ABS9ZC44_9HYPH|nr:glycosyltransferase [Candidatus Rhodoblastus alkanivorans]MCI4678889.1 glycosyltransferase [Candidatus Rhodoblastus alkanivorans]MCI4684187.1 glycosyltransferase [Candidatus Rhodoblastus alkanivorans]MDI4641508.1 glycosyltransferase [Rhodoblastus acidophilus]